MRLLFCFFLLVIASTSIAFKPKIQSVYETHDEIIVHLNKSSYKEFRLHNMNGFTVSRANADGNTITFSVAPRYKINHSTCLYIKNHRRKLIKFHRESKHGFKTSMGKKYIELTSYYEKNNEEIKKIQSEIPIIEKKHKSYKNSLSSNVSYKNQNCYWPAKKTTLLNLNL